MAGVVRTALHSTGMRPTSPRLLMPPQPQASQATQPQATSGHPASGCPASGHPAGCPSLPSLHRLLPLSQEKVGEKELEEKKKEKVELVEDKKKETVEMVEKKERRQEGRQHSRGGRKQEEGQLRREGQGKRKERKGQSWGVAQPAQLQWQYGWKTAGLQPQPGWAAEQGLQRDAEGSSTTRRHLRWPGMNSRIGWEWQLVRGWSWDG